MPKICLPALMPESMVPKKTKIKSRKILPAAKNAKFLSGLFGNFSSRANIHSRFESIRSSFSSDFCLRIPSKFFFICHSFLSFILLYHISPFVIHMLASFAHLPNLAFFFQLLQIPRGGRVPDPQKLFNMIIGQRIPRLQNAQNRLLVLPLLLG